MILLVLPNDARSVEEATTAARAAGQRITGRVIAGRVCLVVSPARKE